MSKYLNCLITLIATVFTLSCVSAQDNNTDSKNVMASIEILSKQATDCLKSNTRTSRSCTSFAKMYKTGGSEAVKQFSFETAKYLEQDLDAALTTTEQIITVGNAVFFLAKRT